MTAYIYNLDNEIVTTVHGDTSQECEDAANELGFMGMDEYGLTYSKAGLSE